MSNSTEHNDSDGKVEFINPDTLSKNPAFTNVVVVSGHSKTVYIGGQDAVDSEGNIVGKGDLAAQVTQVITNLKAALEAGGARPEHVIKWNVYIVQGQSLAVGFGAFQSAWGRQENPPAITGLYVAGLANPDFLVEMDAIAVVPQ